MLSLLRDPYMLRLFWEQWMIDRGSAKLIMRDGGLYLHRRYLMRLWRFATFLHTFWMDDPDPLHDHPWPWGRIILSGRYRETYLDGTSKMFGPGHIVWNRNAETLHRVELQGEPVTTIFWHWKRQRQWGFLHDNGWRATPDDGMDGRPLKGFIFPRKQGPPPAEVVHDS